MTQASVVAHIESLDHEGRGIARVDGKAIFIDGALPYETVTYQSYRVKKSYENADVVDVLKESFLRTDPSCPHFGVCGGCSMQHVEFSAQVAIKQRVLEDDLQHIGRVKAEVVMPPIAGAAWGYRHRARLSARYVAKKDGVLVGFHEKRSSFIADMSECHILPPHISALIVPLRELIAKLSIYNRMPQVEIAVGAELDVLVFRNMDDITEADFALLQAFSDRHSTPQRTVQPWLVKVSLRDIPDPAERGRLSKVTTSFDLKPEEVEALVAAGRALLRDNPEFRRVRAQHPALPVIFLTSKDDEEDEQGESFGSIHAENAGGEPPVGGC